VDDRLFATLDTKTRLLHLAEGREVLLSDTVGFIRHLPHGLVASFQSTLDVASEADVLLIVADASHPCLEGHLAVVRDTLVTIGADGVPALLLLNKWDRIGNSAERDRLQNTYPDACAISARKGSGLGELKALLLSRLEQDGRFVNPTSAPACEPWMDA